MNMQARQLDFEMTCPEISSKKQARSPQASNCQVVDKWRASTDCGYCGLLYNSCKTAVDRWLGTRCPGPRDSAGWRKYGIPVRVPMCRPRRVSNGYIIECCTLCGCLAGRSLRETLQHGLPQDPVLKANDFRSTNAT